MDDILLEPLNAYKTQYKAQFTDNANALFDELVKESGIDAEQNRATAKAYRSESALAEQLHAKVANAKGVGGVLIAVAIICGIAAIAGVVMLVDGNTLAGGLTVGLCGAALIVAISVLLAVVKPKIRALKESYDKQLEKANALKDKAWKQMRALNALFDGSMTKELIEKTVPKIEIDDNFNMRRYDYLCGKYGFLQEPDSNRSTIGILTGEILGNPFVEDREIVSAMGTATYHGSIVISWTTVYTDSEGHSHTQLHTQTLVASVTKPKPVYSMQTRLIYGNDAASDLHFTHSPSHAEELNENELERKVKKGIKRIRKQQEKKREEGSNFTEMGNEEFDVVFGALDRDNEVQFRLLFTPLAQKNMLALMKDDETFGDDFSFSKRGPLNFISSEHSAQWDMDVKPSKYASYDVDIARDNFVKFNLQYFKSLYFDLAPLLSIPLYQQMKPREYIYSENYGRNYTSYEAECAVNRLGQDAFAHPASATQSILKTSFIEKDGKSDRVEVTAYSYRTEDRVDFVPRLGGDGYMHSVPVHWLEYIPIENRSTVKIKELGFTEKEYFGRLAKTSLGEAVAKYGDKFSYLHGLLCCLVSGDAGNFDEELEKAIK